MLFLKFARVAELVDALDSKSSDSNIVPVRPRPRVQKHLQNEGAFFAIITVLTPLFFSQKDYLAKAPFFSPKKKGF